MRPADRAGRVVHSHAIARSALAAAALFAVVAVVWAAVVLVRGGSWWGPLHAFLAGTVLLAISGASQMFTITWAASPAPAAWFAALQRWLVMAGVAAVLIGVTSDLTWLVWIGTTAVAGGLAVLGVSIVRAVRRSLLRRFDLSARFYLTAFAAGLLGVVLGAVLASASAGAAFDRVRLVHSHLNLIGLVGLTIVGTIPTFLPTVAHHRAVSGREAVLAWWLSMTAVILYVAGLAAPPVVVGLGSVLAGVAAALVLGGVVWRLWRKGRGEAAFLQITAGVIWLVVWTLFDGIALMAGRGVMPFSVWTTAVVVAGVGQVLLGSLTYLVPVLLGPPLGERLSLLSRWPLVPLLAANLGGVALVTGLPVPAVVATSVWLADFTWRLVRQKGLAAEG